jgi:hypothetical protein
MLQVRFPPSHPDTVKRKYKNALWSKKNKGKKSILFYQYMIACAYVLKHVPPLQGRAGVSLPPWKR